MVAQYKLIPRISKLGQTKPICPYCSAKLEQMPGRKKKCPSCENFIYVGTRPIDKKKVLIKEEERLQIEREWAALNASIRFNDHNLKEVKQYLHSLKSSDPSKYEGIYLDNGVTYMFLSEMGNGALLQLKLLKFSGFLTAMGDFMQSEMKERQAMFLYMQSLYLHANMAQDANIKNISIAPPFSKEGRISIPVGLVGYIYFNQKCLNYSDDNLIEYFRQEAGIIQGVLSNISGLLNPNQAWEIINNEYEKYVNRYK